MKKAKKIYIANSGNTQQAQHLEGLLIDHGFSYIETPFVDYCICRDDPEGRLLGLVVDYRHMTLRQFYASALIRLAQCDAVLVQHCGLFDSHSAQAEIARARELDIPIFWNIRDLCRWRDQQT